MLSELAGSLWPESAKLICTFVGADLVCARWRTYAELGCASHLRPNVCGIRFLRYSQATTNQITEEPHEQAARLLSTTPADHDGSGGRWLRPTRMTTKLVPQTATTARASRKWRKGREAWVMAGSDHWDGSDLDPPRPRRNARAAADCLARTVQVAGRRRNGNIVPVTMPKLVPALRARRSPGLA